MNKKSLRRFGHPRGTLAFVGSLPFQTSVWLFSRGFLQREPVEFVAMNQLEKKQLHTKP